MTLHIPSRRLFLTALTGIIAAPAIVRAENIMRVKPVGVPPMRWILGCALLKKEGEPFCIDNRFPQWYLDAIVEVQRMSDAATGIPNSALEYIPFQGPGT